jgi:hypothetical protein
MGAIRRLLDALGKEAQSHRRESPGPSLTIRNWDILDAPTRSLQHLEVSVKGARDEITSGFAMGIRISKFDLEKSTEEEDPEREVHERGRLEDGGPLGRFVGDMGHPRYMLREAGEVHGGGSEAYIGIQEVQCV